MDGHTGNRFQRRKQQTRYQLKKAARELVIEKGYATVTIDDIVERADVGRGTFYLHFRDKEDVIWKAIKDDIDTLHIELNQVYQRDSLAHMPYYSYLEMFLHAQRNRSLFETLFKTGGDNILTNRLQSYIAGEIVREINDAGGFPDISEIPADVTACFITGAFAKLMEWWFQMAEPYTPAEMAGMFFSIIHKRKPPDALSRHSDTL